jgi:hypothetical protein
VTEIETEFAPRSNDNKPERSGASMVTTRPSWTRVTYLVVAWLFIVSLLLQVFLAGLSLFVSGSYWDVHVGFGHSVPGLVALLMVIFALWGRLPRAAIWLTVLLFVLVIAQTEVFAAIRADVPLAAALHPVNALILFAIGVGLARRAWSLVRVRTPDTGAEQRSPAQTMSAERHGGVEQSVP